MGGAIMRTSTCPGTTEIQFMTDHFFKQLFLSGLSKELSYSVDAMFTAIPSPRYLYSFHYPT